MKFLLDTNICIFILKGIPKATYAFQNALQNGIGISSLTLAELEFGICNSSNEEKNRVTLMTFLPLIEVLPFESAAALEYGSICAKLRKQGKPIGIIDMLIAAHARSLGLVLVTNNTGEFSRIEQLLLEDWMAS